MNNNNNNDGLQESVNQLREAIDKQSEAIQLFQEEVTATIKRKRAKGMSKEASKALLRVMKQMMVEGKTDE